MPLNKNASYRYRLIDECLRNRGRQWAVTDLHAHVSKKLIEEFDTKPGRSGYAISERQLLDDIAVMRKAAPEGFSAPIVRRNGIVFYADKDFSIHQSPLIRHDLEVLTEAAALLRQFSVFPHHHELDQLVHKLLARVRSIESPALGKDIIQFEKNDLMKGAGFLAPLYECIRQRKTILLVYRPFQPLEEIRTIFHPYLLKEFNNRWFLIGWDQAQRDIRNYALDRIESFEDAQTPWAAQSDFDPETFFSNIVGVTLLKEQKLEQVLIEATAEQAMYIKTKPIHPSQRMVSTEQGRVRFSLCLIPNYELESLLLSFGEKVRVLAPESLQKKLRERVAATLRNYDKG